MMNLTNEQIRAKYDTMIAERLIGERKVLRKLLTAIREDGYHFRINNGEDFETEHTQDVELAMSNCMATDEDYVVVYRIDPDGAFKRMGKFWLVYGNSPEEVIADYGTGPSWESMFSRWFDVATIE